MGDSIRACGTPERRTERREEHPPEHTQASRVEEVRELQSGLRLVLLETGEDFLVDPTEHEQMTLPEAGDTVKLYLDNTRRRVVGVDLNGMSVYYEPDQPAALPAASVPAIAAPTRQDIALYDSVWNGFVPSSPQTHASGSMHVVPPDADIEARTRAREAHHASRRFALLRALFDNLSPSRMRPEHPNSRIPGGSLKRSRL